MCKIVQRIRLPEILPFLFFFAVSVSAFWTLDFSPFRRHFSPFRWGFSLLQNRQTHAKAENYKNCLEAEKMPPAIVPENAISLHTWEDIMTKLTTAVARGATSPVTSCN